MHCSALVFADCVFLFVQALDGYRAMREHDDGEGDCGNKNAHGEDGEDAADNVC